MALDQRVRRLEQQIQILLKMQIQILSDTRERAVQTRTETFPKSWVRPKQTAAKYRHGRRHEIDGTALAGETVDVNPVGPPGDNEGIWLPGIGAVRGAGNRAIHSVCSNARIRRSGGRNK
jgi:hypothetical protein